MKTRQLMAAGLLACGLITLPVPAHSQTITPSTDWWKAGTYADDSPVWWSTDPSTDALSLQYYWQDLQAHQSRFATSRPEMAFDDPRATIHQTEVAFFVDGHSNPELIPAWMAWDAYLDQDLSGEGENFPTRSDLIDEGLSSSGAQVVSWAATNYRQDLSVLRDAIFASNAQLTDLLIQAAASTPKEELSSWVAQGDVFQLARATQTPPETVTQLLATAKRNPIVEVAASSLEYDVYPHLSATDWTKFLGVLRQQAAPRISLERFDFSKNAKSEGLPWLPYITHQKSFGNGYKEELDLREGKLNLLVLGKAVFNGPYPIPQSVGGWAMMTTGCFINYEGPRLFQDLRDTNSFDVTEATTNNNSATLVGVGQELICQGAEVQLDTCYLGHDRGYFGYQKTFVDTPDEDPIFFTDDTRATGVTDCAPFQDISGRVTGLRNQGDRVNLGLQVVVDGQIDPNFDQTRLISGNSGGDSTFTWSNAALSNSQAIVTILDDLPANACTINGDRAAVFSVGEQPLTDLQIRCCIDGGPGCTSDATIGLELQMEEWNPLRPDHTATVTLDILHPDGTETQQTLTAGGSAVSLAFPDEVPLDSVYSATVETNANDLQCSITEGQSGTVDGANVVKVSCVTRPASWCDIRPDLCETPADSECIVIVIVLESSQTHCETVFTDIQIGSTIYFVENYVCINTTDYTLEVIELCPTDDDGDDGSGNLTSGSNKSMTSTSNGPIVALRNRTDLPYSGRIGIMGTARHDDYGTGAKRFFINDVPVTLGNFQDNLDDPFTCNEIPSSNCDAQSGFYGTLDTSLLPDGVHKLTVSVDRGDGGVGSIDEIYITVDNGGNQPYAATVVDTAFPDTMLCGESTWASVTVRNTGFETWTRADGIALGAHGDSDPFQASNVRYRLPQGTTVAPDETYRFFIPLTAPNSAGAYSTDWQMLQIGQQWFGEVAVEHVDVSCQTQVGLSAEFKPGANQPRTSVTTNSSTPAQANFYYDQSLGNHEERPGGACWGGHDNPTYVELTAQVNTSIQGCEFQTSTDSAPNVCTPAQVAMIENGTPFLVNVDENRIDPATCRPVVPADPGFAGGEDHWFRLTVFVNGATIERQINLRQINDTPALDPYMRLEAEYAVDSSATRTTFKSGVSNPPSFDFHYDPAWGHFEQRPGAPCWTGQNNPTYLEIRYEGEPIDSCQFRVSTDMNLTTCSPSLLADLNLGNPIIVGTDTFQIDPSTCQSNGVEWVSPNEANWIQFHLTKAGQTYTRTLNFSKLQ